MYISNSVSAYPSALSPGSSRFSYGGYGTVGASTVSPFRYSSVAPSTRFRDAVAASRTPNFSLRSASVSPASRGQRHNYSYYGKESNTLPGIRSMVRSSVEDAENRVRERRFRSPSMLSERTRDDLIDSIVHTRTREHRAMPGYRDASSWEERRHLKVDCDRVYPGIYLANGETVQNIEYLKSVGVTHVLNTAERHVHVTPSKYPLHNISYFGFHVDDHPTANVARYFTRTSDFIDEALKRGGVVCVNCMMGWSRSATVVAAYLVAKKGMTANQALETIRAQRPIRPNPGFLEQLANYENLIRKKLVWD